MTSFSVDRAVQRFRLGNYNIQYVRLDLPGNTNVMFSITAPNRKFSFPIQFLGKPIVPSDSTTIVVTSIVDGAVTDHIFEKVKQNVDGTFVTDEPSRELNIFTLVTFMYPDCNTLTELFSRYDGGIFAYSNTKIMEAPRKELSPDLTLPYVVTAYNESDLPKPQDCP